MSDLRELMAQRGERRTIGANRPIELDNGAAWYVEHGQIDLFVQRLTAIGPGRRHLMRSATPGMLVWTGGSLSLPEGWRILLVGHHGTQVIGMPGVELAALLGAEELAAEVRRFLGVDGGPPGGDPLSTAGDAFTATVSKAIQNALVAEAEEAHRIESEPRRTRRQLDAALTGLVDVIDRGEPLGTAPSEDELKQVDIALDRIGKAIGVEFPERSAVEEEGIDPIALRVSRADCRLRTVTLGAGWWTQTGMPMLMFESGTERPVAILPERSHHVLFDPVRGTTTPVTSELAASLLPYAYVIYRPLPPGASSPRLLLRSILGSTRRTIALVLGLGALAGLIATIIPIATSLVYSSVIPQGDKPLLAAITALLVGASITWALVVLSQNFATLRFSGMTEIALDPGLIDRLLQLPSSFFRRYDTGDLATRAGGLQTIRQQLSGAVLAAVLTLIFSVSSLALMFFYSPTLALVSLAILVVFAFVIVQLNVRSVRHQHRVLDRTGEIAADLFQAVQGIQKVRAAGAEPRVLARWATRYRLQASEVYAAGRIQAWIIALIADLPQVLAFAIYLVTITALSSKISGGHFVALLTALTQFTTGLLAVALVAGPLLAVGPLWGRLRPILEEPLEERGTRDPGTLAGEIEAQDVSFGYGPDAVILENLKFSVRPGEFVAITGPSGAGKSTLLRLLLGLDAPTSGSILYDGKDLQLLDPKAVRRQIGVVMQQARPLPGEIVSTIVGNSGGGEAEAWEAAEAAELAEDIRKMPMGMHTMIGEGGLAFSGGQIQRMMIARALARRPKVIIFDEATSALDDRTQTRVSERLDRLESTRIVFAHRLSTIRNADHIYVLERGRIVESGTFDELMAGDGLFQRLASRQLV